MEVLVHSSDPSVCATRLRYAPTTTDTSLIRSDVVVLAHSVLSNPFRDQRKDNDLKLRVIGTAFTLMRKDYS